MEALVALLLLASAAGIPPTEAARLERLRIIAPGSTGGGWDQTAHAMREVLLAAGIAQDIEVVNSPGAGGAIGLVQLVSAHKGDGNTLLLGGLVMLSALRTQRATVSLLEATPIARITAEYEVIAVPSASDLRRLEDLVQALKVNPGAVSWAGGSGGGTDQLLIVLVARAIGVEPVRMNYVPFSGGGEVGAALLGHEVSVGVSGLAELAPEIASGRLRALGISSETRLPGVAIPTLREQGIDVTLSNWRGVFAPPDLSETQRAKLADAIDMMVRHEGWRERLARHHWTDLYLPGEGFTRFLEAEQTRALLGPDPRGTRPGGRPGVVWTSGMRILRNRVLLLALLGLAGLLAASLFVWQRVAAKRREEGLSHDLEAAQRRSAEVAARLEDLAEQIDRQFEAWGLTAAEKEVANLMLKGLRHKEIATVRETSERTVRQQALSVYKKAHLEGRTDLAAFFLEDLLTPGDRRQTA